MIENFPKPPSGTFFEVQGIGLGWLRVCLINKENKQIILSKTVGRPHLALCNIVSSVHQGSVDEIKNFEISQERDIKATARELTEEYEKLNNLDDGMIELIEKVRVLSRDWYVGRYE